MSIHLRQTAETMIENALASTGKTACGAGRHRTDRALEREMRFFGFRREALSETGRIRTPSRRDQAMA